ncbi:uncharacterized protein METZ01_LOCUS193072, partial [marine metagenome]
VGLKCFARWDMIKEFDTSNFDNPVTFFRTKASGLRI